MAIMMVHLFGFVLLICSFGGLTSACTVPVYDLTEEALEALQGSKTPVSGFPTLVFGQANRLAEQMQTNKQIKAAQETLKFCEAREDKFSVPGLPSTLVASETCSPADYQFSIPYQVSLNGSLCWVLKPWAGERCNYIKCQQDDCDVPPPGRTIPVSDQYKCKPTNYRSVEAYAICEKNPSGYNMYQLKSFTIPLAQCCSCVKFVCLLKG